MPTIDAALAIENFLPRSTKKIPTKTIPTEEELPAAAQTKKQFYNPSLYAAPAPAPIPDHSSIAFSPTTYVVNHKRRGARSGSANANRTAEINVQLGMVDSCEGNGKVFPGLVGEERDQETDERSADLEGGERVIEQEGDQAFLDSMVSENVGTSGSDVEDIHSPRCVRLGKPLSAQSRSQDEYYDAAEEFFSDDSLSNSSPSSKRSSQNEMHSLRISLIEESSRRKVTESSLLYMSQQWEKVLKCLTQLGLSSPEMHSLRNLKNDVDPSALCQEIVVLKFVSEALETDVAKDEVEDAFKESIISKNHEISRLRDRMLYYEAVNHEMSRRNQQNVDLARSRRLRRKRARRWIWGFVGLSISVGASLLAYSYLPPSGNELSSASQATDSASSTDRSSHVYCDELG